MFTATLNQPSSLVFGSVCEKLGKAKLTYIKNNTVIKGMDVMMGVGVVRYASTLFLSRFRSFVGTISIL